MNYRECAKLLRERDRILLITHRDPDGDTAGSAAALCSALRRLGKEAWLCQNPGYTRKMLPYIEHFLAPEDFVPGCLVAVDVATERMFPAPLDGEILLCVDHHPTNSHYAKNELIRDEKASCGEIVLELIKAYTKQRGTSTLLTLHDLNMAARYADRLVLLKDGVVFREGAPREIITAENIREAYGVEVHVHTSSRTGTPMLLPLHPLQQTDYIF